MAAVFDKPPLRTRRGDLLVFSCLRNERARLPYFLDHYRAQGVTWFFIVDNDSDDGSAEFLKAQPDVRYFHTTQSYVESKAGRFWTTELARHYGPGRWCLTLDVDEILVFPGCEHVTLAELTRHLDAQGFEALFCVFLDMYSDKPLSQAVYAPGTPFIETCPYFEAATYELRTPQNFPYVQIFGGPRQRQFWDGGGKGRGPSMRKTPLVKWRPGFSYRHSTHSMTRMRVADMTGALLHFKFFASFRDLAVAEVARGDRMQMDDYRKYADTLSREDPCFMNPASRRYEDSLSLVEAGAVVATPQLRGYALARARDKRGPVEAEAFRDRFDAATAAHRAAHPSMPLAMLPHLWPFFHAEHFAEEAPAPWGAAQSAFPVAPVAPVPSAGAGRRDAPRGRLLSATAEGLGGWAMDRARPERPLRVAIEVDGRLIAETRTAGLSAAPAAALSDAEAAAEPGLRFQMPRPAALKGRRTAVTVLAGPEDAPDAALVPLPGGAAMVAGWDRLSGSPYAGMVDRWRSGRLRGWAVDRRDPFAPLQVDVLWDGRPLWTVNANGHRPDLVRRFGGGGFHGFAFDPPAGHDDGRPHTLSCRIAHSGIVLARCPVRFEGGAVRLGPLPPAEAVARALRWLTLNAPRGIAVAADWLAGLPRRLGRRGRDGR